KPTPATPMVARFPIVLANSQRVGGRQPLAVSPNGTAFAYVTDAGLYLRTMAEMDAKLLVPGRNVQSPFFSPDGRWVGYWSGAPEQAVKKIAITGGIAVTICKAEPTGVSGIWWDD